MPVEIRLESESAAELAETEAALRTVLDIPETGSRDYRNHGGHPGLRRYVRSDGVLADDVDGAAPVAVIPPGVWVQVPGTGLEMLVQPGPETARVWTRPVPA